MVRIAECESVDKAKPEARDLLRVLQAAGAEGCYIYAFDEDRPQTAYARFFNPTVGLWEDAATGTAAGPLAAYLAGEGLLANNELAIEQGTKMGRRSILRIRVDREPQLSGTGVVVLRGVLRI
jgi:PhzF family phenazine biosynthesis protein